MTYDEEHFYDFIGCDPFKLLSQWELKCQVMHWGNHKVRAIMRAGVKERFIGKISDSRKTGENLKKPDTCDYGL